MICPNCQKPNDLCVCSYIRPVSTKTKVLILQHPQEPDKELGSARMANLCLPNSILKIGLSWPSLKKIIGQEIVLKEWLVLYLGSAQPRREAGTEASPLILVDRHGQPLPHSSDLLSTIQGLVVLDGTWSQAKALWWRNAWLLKLQRGILAPTSSSLYRQLRKEPRPESLSTIEAIALSLSILENNPQISEVLLHPFRQMLQAYRRYQQEKNS
jgi:hypothetical protein